MSRDSFEEMLPAALGEELNEKDNARFKAIIAEDDELRMEYESLCRARDTIAQLPNPESHTDFDETPPNLTPPNVMPPNSNSTHRPVPAKPTLIATPANRWQWGRIAAGWMVAFVGGYAAHGWTAPANNGQPVRQLDAKAPVVTPQAARGDVVTTEDLLRDEHRKRAGSTMLSSSMVAMLRSSGS